MLVPVRSWTKVFVPTRTFYFATAQKVTGASLKFNSPKTCSACGEHFDAYAFHCAKCHALGPRWSRGEFAKNNKEEQDLNPWDIFQCLKDREPTYRIDEKALDVEYRQLMTKLHPDLVQASGGDSAAQELASDHCGVLRACYDILKDPVCRAIALLRWKYSCASLEENSSIEDGKFLMEMLEANEVIDEVLMAHDERGIRRLEQLEGKWEKAFGDLKKQIADEVDALEESGDRERESRLSSLVGHLQKCRIVQKLVERAHEAGISLEKEDLIS